MTSMETTLTSASTKNTSLRTTVPAAVVKQLHLNEGDKIYWDVDYEYGKRYIIIRPKKYRS